jgi:hypothetical protein
MQSAERGQNAIVLRNGFACLSGVTSCSSIKQRYESVRELFGRKVFDFSVIVYESDNGDFSISANARDDGAAVLSCSTAQGRELPKSECSHYHEPPLRIGEFGLVHLAWPIWLCSSR